jgi:hypothetical protein
MPWSPGLVAGTADDSGQQVLQGIAMELVVLLSVLGVVGVDETAVRESNRVGLLGFVHFLHVGGQ